MTCQKNGSSLRMNWSVPNCAGSSPIEEENIYGYAEDGKVLGDKDKGGRRNKKQKIVERKESDLWAPDSS